MQLQRCVVARVGGHVLVGLADVFREVDAVAKGGARVDTAEALVEAVGEEVEQPLWARAMQQQPLVCALREREAARRRRQARRILDACPAKLLHLRPDAAHCRLVLRLPCRVVDPPGAAELEVVVRTEPLLHVLALAELGRVLRHEQPRERAEEVWLLARDDRPQREANLGERVARLCVSRTAAALPAECRAPRRVVRHLPGVGWC